MNSATQFFAISVHCLNNNLRESMLCQRELFSSPFLFRDHFFIHISKPLTCLEATGQKSGKRTLLVQTQYHGQMESFIRAALH